MSAFIGTKIIEEQISKERRENYRIMLEQILASPERLLQYSMLRKWTLEQSYIAIDMKIRELK